MQSHSATFCWIICYRKFRACLKTVNTPKWRSFFRHTSPIILEIHPVFLRTNVFVWRKNSSPLCIFPFVVIPFNQAEEKPGLWDISENIIRP